MSTEKKRIMITVNEDIEMQIESYRNQNGLSTSQAANELIRKGILAEDERLHAGGVYDGQEIRLVSVFRRADPENRSKIMDDLIHSVARNKYKHPRHKREQDEMIADNSIGDVVALMDLYHKASPELRTKVLDILTEECDNFETTFANELKREFGNESVRQDQAQDG